MDGLEGVRTKQGDQTEGCGRCLGNRCQGLDRIWLLPHHSTKLHLTGSSVISTWPDLHNPVCCWARWPLPHRTAPVHGVLGPTVSSASPFHFPATSAQAPEEDAVLPLYP